MSETATRPSLYEPESIAIATFLGSPLAGAALWALNERRVGRSAQAWMALVAGVLALVVLFVVGSFVPAGAMTGASIGLTFGARAAARGWHDQRKADGLATEPVYESRWKAAGMGVLSLVLVLGASVGLAFLDELGRGSVEVRPGATVYFDAPLTEDQARTMGARIRALGFFDGDHVVDVLYQLDGDVHAVSFVVAESFLREPGVEDQFRDLSSQLHVATGAPVELRLCDELFEPHHRYRSP